ncbi:TIR domain-containing protein [Streptomyces flavofungini]|uniref:TIR domain-containing protein n=1 Tax=Streptomyces flavofungini TaxID=68200 RepID=UPI0025B05689|nr:TIR domain-containing protein [Streptomyces flavofungini]WJV50056.1 TIR domain-containing protein [Streptomyces flavofungini]
MHEIFINYRTKGGKDIAYRCEEALSERFGPDSVFLAGNGIGLGSDYTQALPRAVRRSRVLLVIIDEQWLDVPDPKRPGRRALANAQDWVRREIEEAFDSGVLVVPLLVGRHMEQIDPHRLPKSIEQLAVCQYARLQSRTFATDVAILGDRLVQQVPGLAGMDSRESEHAPDVPEGNPTVRNDHQSGGIGHVSGTFGTFVGESHSPMHTGSGDMITHKNSDGTTHVAGDNMGGIHHEHGQRHRRTRRDDDR